MTKSEAGSKGGRALLDKKGPAYFSEIGRKGAAVTWTKYKLVPVRFRYFAMVDRETGKIVSHTFI